jgi:hypothetical protein
MAQAREPFTGPLFPDIYEPVALGVNLKILLNSNGTLVEFGYDMGKSGQEVHGLLPPNWHKTRLEQH